jgi:putative endonuclease
MERIYFVYILASRSRNLYVGVANNLVRRLILHRQSSKPAFAAKYRTYRLVHFECFNYVWDAIAREKQLKNWRREKKLSLIEARNPTWLDLSESWFPKSEIQIPRLRYRDPEPIAINRSARDDKK